MLTREVHTIMLVLKVFSAGVVVIFLLDLTIYIGCN
jgi:hypothetical protein